MKHFAGKVPFSVHYYRQPMPLPSEWKHDLEHMVKLGIGTIQLRPHWRWHERTEGKFQWDDIDRLMDLAEKNKIGVVFKFMMETAPDWLYRDYQATRITPDGRQLTPQSISSMYPGGWLPCFDNPLVRERVRLFVENGVQRYRRHPALACWHVWNEPRSRPYGECACGASVRSYRLYLKKRFKNVEVLNNWIGKCWASFEDVLPPLVSTTMPRRTCGGIGRPRAWSSA